MRGRSLRKHHRFTAFILVSFLLFSACERNNYELLDPASAGKWTFYTTADGLPGNRVTDIKLDSKNNLWFSFPGQGTAKFDNISWTYYKAGTSPLLNNLVNCVAETADGKMIFGTSNGLSILSITNVWSSYIDPVTNMYVNAIKVASNGWIWVGTESQGFYVNSGSGFTKTLTDTYKNVHAIEEGSAGTIFIGTDNGIVKWDGSSYSYITKASGLPSDKVSSIRFDSKKRLWVGTDGGRTVAWIDTKGIHQLDLMTSTDSLFVKDIHEDRKGDIWFATHRTGLIRFDGIIPLSVTTTDGFPEDKVNCIAEDKDGNLWFGLESKGIARYTLSIPNK
jgi:ligand-binding sensor domain-containing protein